MDTIKKVIIHRLTTDFVEIDTEQYAEIGGKETKLNENDFPKHSVHYVNSLSGRELLMDSQPENVVTAVMAIWGDAATVEDPEEVKDDNTFEE